MLFMHWYTAPSPSSVELMSLTGNVFAGNVFRMACRVTLPPTVDVPVDVNVEWSEPAEATLNFTSPVMMTENQNEYYVSTADVVSNVQSERISFQCRANVDSDSPFVTASETAVKNASIFVVGRPSEPTELNASASSTVIHISWSQRGTDVVYDYRLHYSYHIRECQGNATNISSIPIENSTRSYTLMGLEEDSEFNISLTASNPAGESEPATIATATLPSGTA